MNVRDFCRQVKRATKKLGLRWSYCFGAIRSQYIPIETGSKLSLCLCPLTAVRYLQAGKWEDQTLAAKNLGLNESEGRNISQVTDCHMRFLTEEQKLLRRKILRACGR